MEPLEALLEVLTPLTRLGRPALAAVDGRCGSGKSTLSELAARRLHCPLFHMDDFFLPPELRTPQRYAQPGGNVHYERVEAELKDDTRTNLETYREQVVDAINNDIVLRHGYQAGVIEHSLGDDPEVKRALEVLGAPEEYARITTSQDTARK